MWTTRFFFNPPVCGRAIIPALSRQDTSHFSGKIRLFCDHASRFFCIVHHDNIVAFVIDSHGQNNRRRHLKTLIVKLEFDLTFFSSHAVKTPDRLLTPPIVGIRY